MLRTVLLLLSKTVEPEKVKRLKDCLEKENLALEVFGVVSGFDNSNRQGNCYDELWQLCNERAEKNGDCILVTDLECVFLKRVLPIVGLLSEENEETLTYKYLTCGVDGLDAGYLKLVYNRFYGLPCDIFQTERLVVREMTREDIDALYEIYDDEAAQFTERLEKDREAQLISMKSYIENMYGFFGYGLWMVCEKESGRAIGRAGLSNLRISDKTYLELGYIIEKAFRSRGYATEVCRAILEYAGEVLGEEEVVCRIASGNRASLRVAEKLGFEPFNSCESDSEIKYYKVKL